MFKLQFKTSNDECANAPEYAMASYLRQVERQILCCKREGNIFDTNGNTIGKWEAKI
jgi:hypothetical protein